MVLPILLGCTTLNSLKRTPASNPDLIAKCGFGTRSDILLEATSILERFSAFKVGDLGNQDGELLSLSEVSPHRELQKIVANNLAKISQNKSLYVPMANRLLGIKYISLPDCNDLPCAIPKSFSVSLPLEWAESLSKTTSTEEFKTIILFILGHEFGHHVYYAIFRNDSSYPRISQNEALTPLKYHLTVDAIGTILTGLSLDDAAFTLQKTAGSGRFEGDAISRLTCIRELK